VILILSALLIIQKLVNYQEDKMLVVGFDPFTGLSNSGVSGASGSHFVDSKCRTYKGDRKLPGLDRKKLSTKQDGDCEKWVVITTINPPTKTMEVLEKVEGWCMVIVFDKKTPAAAYSNRTTSNRLVFFTVEMQLKFQKDKNLQSVKLIPWNHFGRKNVGFLYAISQGAKVIYDTDDDNIPLQTSLPLDSPLENLQSGQKTVNIYRQFTDHRVWPRGFPLEDLRKEKDLSCCKRTESCRPVWVQQFLAQHDPDVDAIYRLTSSLPLDFNTSRTGLAIPEGTYIPYNAQATLHQREAFFGLLLPITVHGRVSDIWRSYFTQRLLSLAGASLAFLPPLVKQERNVHDYLADLDSEVPLYMKAGQLVEFLGNWTPNAGLSSAEVVLELGVAMYEHCYWEAGDVSLLAAWLGDLAVLGYDLPAFQGGKDKMTTCTRVNC